LSHLIPAPEQPGQNIYAATTIYLDALPCDVIHTMSTITEIVCTTRPGPGRMANLDKKYITTKISGTTTTSSGMAKKFALAIENDEKNTYIHEVGRGKGDQFHYMVSDTPIARWIGKYGLAVGGVLQN
jgi:hypothetical protein